MSLGGLVGFGVLAVVLVTAFSLIATGWFALATRQLRARGPAAERSAAAWALLSPIALAVTIVGVIVAVGSGSVDHCIGHQHHAHFCLVHGAAWLERPWAVALAAASTITFVSRIAVVIWRRERARHAIAQVRRVSELGDRVRIARSDRVFCFVAGLRRPEVFMSSRAWDALSDDERDAVVAHEHAHADSGDLWMGTIIDLASTMAAPLAGAWLHARWTDATERLCDAHAARATAPETVASALLQMCRSGNLQSLPGSFMPGTGTLEQRVRAVLAHGPIGTRLGWLAWAFVVAAIGAATLLASQLHHALETLLG